MSGRTLGWGSPLVGGVSVTIAIALIVCGGVSLFAGVMPPFSSWLKLRTAALGHLFPSHSIFTEGWTSIRSFVPTGVKPMLPWIVLALVAGLLLLYFHRRRLPGRDIATDPVSPVSTPPSKPVSSSRAPERSELAAALRRCRRAFLSVGLFSGVSNILMLTGAIFMLEIYDRVLPSRSVPTLVGLAMLAAVLF